MSIEDLCYGDVVVVQKPTHTMGASGGDVRTWSDIATKDCRLQSISAAEVQKYDARGSRIGAQVFFSADPGVSVDYRLKHIKRNGTALTTPAYYRVLVSDDDNNGSDLMLWTVTCELETTRGED